VISLVHYLWRIFAKVVWCCLVSLCQLQLQLQLLLLVASCVSSVVHYLALVMHLSCDSSVVLLNCLPSLRFDKKKICICYQGFFIVGFL
jgi:hypothetical protein